MQEDEVVPQPQATAGQGITPGQEISPPGQVSPAAPAVLPVCLLLDTSLSWHFFDSLAGQGITNDPLS